MMIFLRTLSVSFFGGVKLQQTYFCAVRQEEALQPRTSWENDLCHPEHLMMNSYSVVTCENSRFLKLENLGSEKPSRGYLLVTTKAANLRASRYRLSGTALPAATLAAPLAMPLGASDLVVPLAAPRGWCSAAQTAPQLPAQSQLAAPLVAPLPP